MPIHDLGYREWSGQKHSTFLRCWTVAYSGIRIAARNKWLRRILIVAWIPALVCGGFLFFYEQALERSGGAMQNDGASVVLEGLAQGMLESETVVDGLNAEDPGEGRNIIWRWIISSFLRLPQAGWTMLVIGMLAPPLIARDIRSKAFLLYFSRPINRYEYVIGKVLIVAAYIAFITMLPALGVYFAGVVMSSDPGAILDTWDIPFRIIAASAVFIVPSVSLALMFSSLTSESRFAAFAWFTAWVLGAVAWRVIYAVLVVAAVTGQSEERMELGMRSQEVNIRFNEAMEELGIPEEQRYTLRVQLVQAARGASDQLEDVDLGPLQERKDLADEFITIEEEYDRLNKEQTQRQIEANRHPASVVSLYDTLVSVQRWIFGLEKLKHVWPAIVMALLVTVGSWFILLQRVTAPIRI